MTTPTHSDCWRCHQPVPSDDRACGKCGKPVLFGRRYRVQDCLGAGASGTVYLCQDLHIPPGQVALKAIHEFHFSGPRLQRAIEALKHEAGAHAKIEGEHVVPIRDFNADERFIVMSYIRGESLAARHDREPDYCRRNFDVIFPQLCNGLDAAHKVGVIHRDVKQENILIDENECIWVADFGVAKTVDAKSVGWTRPGTPEYQAPEVWRKEDVDHRCDIYSLGVLVYHIWTGMFPFTGDILDVEKGHLLQNPRPPTEIDPSIPGYIDEMVDRMLAKEPDKRFSSVEECLDFFDEHQRTAPEHTIQGLQTMLQRIYGTINGKRRGPSIMLNVHIAHGALVRPGVVHRRPTDKPEREVVGKFFGWMMAVANKFRFDAASALWNKYPGKCPYCDQERCQCPEGERPPFQRREPQGRAPSDFDTFGELFRSIYRPDDRDIPTIVARLSLELAELSEAVQKYRILGSKGKEVALEHEFADVLAWTFAYLNKTGVDFPIAAAIYETYPDKCTWCGHPMCKCDEVREEFKLLEDDF